jgi:hypothetical protein
LFQKLSERSDKLLHRAGPTQQKKAFDERESPRPATCRNSLLLAARLRKK